MIFRRKFLISLSLKATGGWEQLFNFLEKTSFAD